MSENPFKGNLTAFGHDHSCRFVSSSNGHEGATVSYGNPMVSCEIYILGANPLRKSYVTGYGEDSLQTVYGLLNQDNRPGIIKGLMPLGPNRYNNPGISIFPAKNFMDCAVEWTTNEHTVGSTANLVFITAYANSNLNAPVS